MPKYMMLALIIQRREREYLKKQKELEQQKLAENNLKVDSIPVVLDTSVIELKPVDIETVVIDSKKYPIELLQNVQKDDEDFNWETFFNDEECFA